jgi:hypothetical protein
MVARTEAHDLTVQAPWYAPGVNVAIHRYLDPGFVAQFQAEVANAPQSNPNLFAWQQEDSMPDQGGLLKLRRPVHRTFHMLAWEASCQIPGAPWAAPAVAPEKIASAGFVLRDVSGAVPLGFQLVRGVPQGWAAVDPTADPDAVRQVRALSLVPRGAAPSPGYTGEQTYPLHPLAVQAGATPHTLLYGFLPIGGGDYTPPAAPAPAASNAAEDLPWPFGLAGYSNGPPATYTADQQVIQGALQGPMAALLRVLLGRYQLAGPDAWTDPANLPLVAILGGIGFYTAPAAALALPDLRAWAAAHPVAGVTLASLLQGWTAAAPAEGASLASLATLSPAQHFLSALNEAYPNGPVSLPAAPGLPAGSANLLVSATVAAQLQGALRLRQAQAATADAMPTPRLTSGPAGRYAVVAFARTIRPDGCERIYWSQPSAPFALAALFDPAAARPSLIEMPDLADARKGLARGASFKLPANLADLVNGLSNSAATKAMWNGSGSAPSGGLGIGFICSFSLPVISICAMLMLSIVISLLNIFLGWMAWVKICLPVPKSSGS